VLGAALFTEFVKGAVYLLDKRNMPDALKTRTGIGQRVE
jgi:hypothetical protein